MGNMMASISEANKRIAKAAAEAFGGFPSVFKFWDDNHKSHVDVLSCKDRPQKGVTSYSTIGLSDHPLYKDGKEYPVRLEMVGACDNVLATFDNVLATAAFCVINSQWFCYPGAVFSDVLSMYEGSKTLRHLLFVPPVLWEDHLKTLDLGEKKVAWLLGVPISEEERRFAEDNGSDRLEELFEERQIDIFDLDRPSVV